MTKLFMTNSLPTLRTAGIVVNESEYGTERDDDDAIPSTFKKFTPKPYCKNGSMAKP